MQSKVEHVLYIVKMRSVLGCNVTDGVLRYIGETDHDCFIRKDH